MFQFAPGLFDFGVGDERLVRDDGTPNSPFWFDSTADAWRDDRQMIGGDFRCVAYALLQDCRLSYQHFSSIGPWTKFIYPLNKTRWIW